MKPFFLLIRVIRAIRVQIKEAVRQDSLYIMSISI